MPSFSTVLRRIAQLWSTKRSDLQEQVGWLEGEEGGFWRGEGGWGNPRWGASMGVGCWGMRGCGCGCGGGVRGRGGTGCCRGWCTTPRRGVGEWLLGCEGGAAVVVDAWWSMHCGGKGWVWVWAWAEGWDTGLVVVVVMKIWWVYDAGTRSCKICRDMTRSASAGI